MLFGKRTSCFFYILIFIATSCTKNVFEPKVSVNENNIDQNLQLPQLIIETKNQQKITDTDNYIDGTIDLSDGINFDRLVDDITIKGRGNSTWHLDKKPFQIRLNSSSTVLDMPKSKTWVLLANYSDKSMLRNQVGFALGKLSNLKWTPSNRFVELFLNNQYQGIYQLTEKIEVKDNRLELDEPGFLLEVDQPDRLSGDAVFFNTKRFLFNIKHPKTIENSTTFNTIKELIIKTENTIYSSGFLDPDTGYTSLIDIESFADWYLINEIAKNTDAAFYSSMYFHYATNGKLKIGPVWDFDISFGNVDYNSNNIPEGFWLKNKGWFIQLFKDPIFVEKVKSRFEHFYNNQDVITESIESGREQLSVAIESNYEKWPILGQYVWPNDKVFNTYDEEVDYLKDWITLRMEWLNIEIQNL